MTMEGIEAMRDAIRAELERDVQFEPGPYYEPEGDCIYYFRFEAVTQAVRVNDLLTVHYDLDTRKVAGVQLKHVHRVLQRIKEKVGSIPDRIKLDFVIDVITLESDGISRDVLTGGATIEDVKALVGEEFMPPLEACV